MTILEKSTLRCPMAFGLLSLIHRSSSRIFFLVSFVLTFGRR